MRLLPLGSTVGAAIAYFLAVRLGLAVLTDGVAVFWPAAGLAVGSLVTMGRRGRGAVVIGVVAATIAANLMGDRSLWTSVFKGFCDGGEAVLTAWLIEQWFGGAFAFDDVRHVVGFIVAAGVAAIVSTVAAATSVTLLHAASSFWDVWRVWFLADVVGIVVVAPLLIALGQLWRELPSRADSIEGLAVLTASTLAGMYSVAQPLGSWATYDANAVVVPLLLWLTARCPPIFGIAGAFVWCITVVCALRLGIGHFGDPGIALNERLTGAQVAVAMVTLSTGTDRVVQ
jgi:integral membrane sensor domain MASE1